MHKTLLTKRAWTASKIEFAGLKREREREESAKKTERRVDYGVLSSHLLLSHNKAKGFAVEYQELLCSRLIIAYLAVENFSP